MTTWVDPPEGWVPFGTHAYPHAPPLEFSEELDDGGTPKWERCRPELRPSISTLHALYVGWVLGSALRHNLPFQPVVDAFNNYTDRLRLVLSPTVTVEVVVPQPPEGWTWPPEES